MLSMGLGAAAGAAAGNLGAESATGASCETPAQDQGPFYPKHQQADTDADLTRIHGRADRAEGDVVYVSGQVLDDDFNPVSGALVDVWQANAHGRYHHEDDPNSAPRDENFQGWAQIRTDDQGHYGFKTIVPGAYPVDEEWWRPPHIHFKISKRGYHELTTQMYFAGHDLNATDSILLGVPESERGKLVVDFVAGGVDDEPGSKRGQFNIMLRRVQTT